MKILFVCTANRVRSRGAAAWFDKQFPEHEFDSCGTFEDAVENTKITFPGAQMITRELINWADKIVFMEREHLTQTLHLISPFILDDKKFEVWDLPDNFNTYNSPNLIKCFEALELDDFFT